MVTKNIQGIDVPEIGLGTFKLIGKECEQIVKLALNSWLRIVFTKVCEGRAVQGNPYNCRFPKPQMFVMRYLYKEYPPIFEMEGSLKSLLY